MTVTVQAVGEGFIAGATIGGVTVRSPWVANDKDALQQFFARIANNGDDAMMGVMLALDGTDLKDIFSDDVPRLESPSVG
jgi:hypothetical protein